jgi:hypothetical protein
MRGISNKPVSYVLLQLLDENNKKKSNKNTSKFKRNIQLVFEEQKKLLSALAPSSYYPYRFSTKPLLFQLGQENDPSRTSYSKLEGPR